MDFGKNTNNRYPLRSPEFHDFLAKCLEKSPKLRPTATEMLKHPFVANCDTNPQILLDLIKRKKRLDRGDDFLEDEESDDSNDDTGSMFVDENEVCMLK
jgi:serine/threonine protein kinase